MQALLKLVLPAEAVEKVPMTNFPNFSTGKNQQGTRQTKKQMVNSWVFRQARFVT
jgi:hypothetical protein